MKKVGLRKELNCVELYVMNEMVVGGKLHNNPPLLDITYTMLTYTFFDS